MHAKFSSKSEPLSQKFFKNNNICQSPLVHMCVLWSFVNTLFIINLCYYGVCTGVHYWWAMGSKIVQLYVA